MRWLDGHEFEQALGDGEGQGNLVCCRQWGHKELDMTEQLNNNEYKYIYNTHADMLLLIDVCVYTLTKYISTKYIHIIFVNIEQYTHTHIHANI